MDDVNLAGTEKRIDSYTGIVEDTFGKCKIHKHDYTCIGVHHAKLENGDVISDQDEYIKTMRPIVSPELTGQPPEAPAKPWCRWAVFFLFWQNHVIFRKQSISDQT